MGDWKPPTSSRPLTAAERNRRRRWREKHDMIHIPGLDVSVQKIAALVELGYLEENLSEDKRAMSAAAERYINETLPVRASDN